MPLPAEPAVHAIASPHDGSAHPAEMVDADLRHTHNSEGRLIHPTAEGRANFHRWHEGSKVVDAHGRPKVMYHGTNQGFTSFAKSALGSNSKTMSTKHGFFFTDNAEEAGAYAHMAATRTIPDGKAHARKSAQLSAQQDAAERRGDWPEHERLTHGIEKHELDAIHGEPSNHQVMPVYIRAKNPHVVHADGPVNQGAISAAADEAKAMGRDAVTLSGIHDDPRGYGAGTGTTHILTFHASQVKSAVGNTGSFNAKKIKMTEQLVSRIDRFLGKQITESAHGQLAVKMLAQHGMVPEGVNPAHIAKGIAKHHGVPMALVPQMVHYAAATLALHDDGTRDRIENPGIMRSGISSAIHAHTEQENQRRRPEHLSAYADIGRGGHLPMSTASSSRDLPSVMESAADSARQWHEIATHPKSSTLLAHGTMMRFNDDNETQTDHEVGDHLEAKFNPDRDRRVQLGDTARSPSPLEVSHRRVVATASAYNPMQKDTWHPGFTGGVAHYVDPLTHTAMRGENCAANIHVCNTSKVLTARRGLVIPHTPDAEHTHGGNTYRAYTLDTPDKANQGCWGEKFCIAAGSSASRMNEHYHGGKYKPAHIITKMATGDDGKPKETLHSAYLPELLPGQKHEDPEQAVRNSGNNGPVTGAAFKEIHPLLSKLDPRIDKKFRGHPPVHAIYSDNKMHPMDGG